MGQIGQRGQMGPMRRVGHDDRGMRIEDCGYGEAVGIKGNRTDGADRSDETDVRGRNIANGLAVWVAIRLCGVVCRGGLGGL